MWNERTDPGEPYDNDSATAALIDELTTYHSGYYIDDSIPPAPLFIYNAWTDDLFPADEGLRFWLKTRARHPAAEVAVLFADDFGHPRASLGFGGGSLIPSRVTRFFDRHLKGSGEPLPVFEVFTQGCRGASPLGSFTSDDWEGLHPGEVAFATDEPQAFGLKKPDQKPFVDQLKGIAAMNMSKAQLENLKPEDRAYVRNLAQQTQQGFEHLLKALKPYPKARTYIENLVNPVTTFLRWWLQKSEALPFTTNAIESHFSQICNRIKRIGRRWSDQGLLNWLTVCFYKIFKPNLWRHQWENTPRKITKISLRSFEATYQWAEAIT